MTTPLINKLIDLTNGIIAEYEKSLQTVYYFDPVGFSNQARSLLLKISHAPDQSHLLAHLSEEDNKRCAYLHHEFMEGYTCSLGIEKQAIINFDELFPDYHFLNIGRLLKKLFLIASHYPNLTERLHQFDPMALLPAKINQTRELYKKLEKAGQNDSTTMPIHHPKYKELHHHFAEIAELCQVIIQYVECDLQSAFNEAYHFSGAFSFQTNNSYYPELLSTKETESQRMLALFYSYLNLLPHVRDCNQNIDFLNAMVRFLEKQHSDLD